MEPMAYHFFRMSHSVLKLVKVIPVTQKKCHILQGRCPVIPGFAFPLQFFHSTRNMNLRKRSARPTLAQLDYVSKLEDESQKEGTQDLLRDSTNFSADKGLYSTDVWHSNAYDETAHKVKKSLQGIYYSAPNLDHEKTSVIMFPGQGTQCVGMCKHLLGHPNVKEMYEVASDILEYDLLDLSLNGPANNLNKTEYQQPAILVSSLASVEKLRAEKPEMLECCVATAGFSIGEITALTFAGAISFESAVRLVKIRGEAMQIASNMQPSGMMTVFYGPDSKLGLAFNVAREYCQRLNLETIDIRVANYLYPHCKIIAGNQEALDFIDQNKDDFKLKKLKRINVSGAFHTELMKPASFVFNEALKNTHVRKPLIPVYSNIDGKKYRSANHILRQLPKQIYKPVKWEQVLHAIYDRPASIPYPYTYECGPGSTLTSILKKVDARAGDRCWGY